MTLNPDDFIGDVLKAKSLFGERPLDLRETKARIETLAPAFATQLQALSIDAGVAANISRALFTSYQGLKSSATVTGVVSFAVNAVGDLLSWLQNASAKAASENHLRRVAARDRFVQRYYQPGYFAQVCYSQSAPNPHDLVIVDGSLSQYDPDYIVRVARPLRRDVVHPTWPTPPYDEGGVTPSFWGDGWTPMPALLGGFSRFAGIIDTFWDRPPVVKAIPGKYREKYWAQVDPDLPTDEGGRVDWTSIDQSILAHGYAPPPGYTYLRSWGTYPDDGWYLAPGGSPVDPVYAPCAAEAALAAAIHSLTPIHAAIRLEDVAQCYRHWVAASGWRSLPRLPRGQVDLGHFLDEELLPWGASELPTTLRTPAGPQLPWQQVRRVEVCFRRWFALRRAAVMQFSFCPESFRTACIDSPDPVLRALGRGGQAPDLPRYVPADPLGEGWIPAVPEDDGDNPDRGSRAPDRRGRDDAPGRVGRDDSGRGAGGLLLGGAAVAAGALWLRLRG